MEQAQNPNEHRRLYVIGDIHGRLDLLDRMIAAIERDVKEHGPNCLTVTVGDYIDRGPKSPGVLERLSDNPFPCDYIALKGNHEAMLEAFLADPKTGSHWQHLGGMETLHSFGIRFSSLLGGRSFEKAAEDLRAALSSKQTEFLSSLKMSLTSERYFICHAGVRPGVPLDQQEPDDLLWIRDEFLDSTEDFGKVVVHGHTPTVEPQVRPNRINIDTGAFATGRLTCVVLEGAQHRFIMA
jgi:serine/threonine protein phosphatase 1